MAASNSGVPGTRPDRTGDRLYSRYDLLLSVIPAAFLVALVVSLVSPLPVTTLLAVASIVGAFAVADGLFVNPPDGPEGGTIQ